MSTPLLARKMRNKRFFFASFFNLLTFISLPSYARWYQVEVVVFENTATMEGTQEQWPELSALLDLNDTVILSPPVLNESNLKQEDTNLVNNVINVHEIITSDELQV